MIKIGQPDRNCYSLRGCLSLGLVIGDKSQSILVKKVKVNAGNIICIILWIGIISIELQSLLALRRILNICSSIKIRRQ